MRLPHHLSPEEFKDYAAHMSRLEDATLSPEEHAKSQARIDKLLWKDPDGRINSLEARIAAIEDHLGIKPASGVAPKLIGTPVNINVEGGIINEETLGQVQKKVGDEIRQRMGLTSSASVTSIQTSPGVEGYVVFNAGVDNWLVKSSDPGLRDFGPYPTAEQAQLVADRLNSGPEAIPAPAFNPPSQRTGGAGQSPEVVATSPTEVHARPAAQQSEDGRGRPSNRFKVSGKRGNWFVEDTTGAIPADKFPSWKLKKDCANSAKGLNGHPNPDSLFMGPAPGAAPPAAPAQVTQITNDPAYPVDENAPIQNWDPDPIPVAAPVPQQVPGYAEPVGPTEAAAIAAQGQAPAAIPATGHTNAPVAGGGVIVTGGDIASPEGVVIHKPSDADRGIHLMAAPDGTVMRVDPMGLGDI